MKTRTLGHGLKVSAIGIGCMTMGAGSNIVYGEAGDKDESIRTIHEAIDLGVTFFDTAQIYGPFSNEELVGEAIKGKRDSLVIATKFGFKIENNSIAGVDSSDANIRHAVEGSLKRLGIDCIDLYYQHRVDPSVPIEDVMHSLLALKTEGKIAHIGLSEAGPETLRRAAAIGPVTALQSEYSLWERDVEDEILETCRANGIGFVPYSPLGRGFLTGQIKSRDDLTADDWRRIDPRYSEANFDINLRLVETVKTVAAQHNVSPAQIALAWLLAQGDDIVPIPGSKRRTTMMDSVAAADVTLSTEDVSLLSTALAPGVASGNRYSEIGMRMVRR